MGIANHGVLLFGPLQNGQRPGRPLLDLAGPRKIVLFQTEQADMSGVRGGKAGDLHVVTQQVLPV